MGHQSEEEGRNQTALNREDGMRNKEETKILAIETPPIYVNGPKNIDTKPQISNMETPTTVYLISHRQFIGKKGRSFCG